MKCSTLLISLLPIVSSVYAAREQPFVPLRLVNEDKGIQCFDRFHSRADYKQRIDEFCAKVPSFQGGYPTGDFFPRSGQFEVVGPYFRVRINPDQNDFIIINTAGIVAGAIALMSEDNMGQILYERCLVMLPD